MASIQITQASRLGLPHDPFSPQPARRGAIHVTPALAGQLEILKKIVATGMAVTLVKGRQGAGKTTLLNRLAEDLQYKMGIELIRVDATDEISFVHLLGHDFGVIKGGLTADQVRNRLAELLSKLRQGGLTVVVAVDDAHRLSLPNLAELIELTEPVAPHDYGLLHTMLFAEPDIDAKLEALPRPLPRERVSILSLGEDNLDEARSYIRHRLENAGYANSFPFSRNELTRIQRNSKGLSAQTNSQAAHRRQRPEHSHPSPVAAISCKIRSHQWLLAGVGSLAVMIVMGLLVEKAIWSPVDSEAPVRHHPSPLQAATPNRVDQAWPEAPPITPSVSETSPEVSNAPTPQEQHPEETAVDADQPSQSPSVHSADWFGRQPPAGYVIQVIATTTEPRLQSFLTRYDWPAEASYLRTRSKGGQWHILVLGPYATRQEARSVLSSLPEEALRNRPWIRRVGSVQMIMDVLR